MTAHRQCIFCHHVFPLIGGELPEECPECGTDLPDESFVVAVPAPFADEGTLEDFDPRLRSTPKEVDLDRTDRLPALSVIHESSTDELDPTRIDNSAPGSPSREPEGRERAAASGNASLPTVQDANFSAGMADATLRTPLSAPPLESHPTITGDRDSGNGRPRDPRPRAPRAPLVAPSVPFSHQQDIPTYAGDVDDTGQHNAFDDATYSQPTMDLDALAAAVPDKEAAPTTTPQTWACPACGAEWTAVSAEFCPACDWRNDESGS